MERALRPLHVEASPLSDDGGGEQQKGGEGGAPKVARMGSAVATIGSGAGSSRCLDAVRKHNFHCKASSQSHDEGIAISVVTDESEGASRSGNEVRFAAVSNSGSNVERIGAGFFCGSHESKTVDSVFTVPSMSPTSSVHLVGPAAEVDDATSTGASPVLSVSSTSSADERHDSPWSPPSSLHSRAHAEHEHSLASPVKFPSCPSTPSSAATAAALSPPTGPRSGGEEDDYEDDLEVGDQDRSSTSGSQGEASSTDPSLMLHQSSASGVSRHLSTGAATAAEWGLVGGKASNESSGGDEGGDYTLIKAAAAPAAAASTSSARCLFGGPVHLFEDVESLEAFLSENDFMLEDQQRQQMRLARRRWGNVDASREGSPESNDTRSLASASKSPSICFVTRCDAHVGEDGSPCEHVALVESVEGTKGEWRVRESQQQHATVPRMSSRLCGASLVSSTTGVSASRQSSVLSTASLPQQRRSSVTSGACSMDEGVRAQGNRTDVGIVVRNNEGVGSNFAGSDGAGNALVHGSKSSDGGGGVVNGSGKRAETLCLPIPRRGPQGVGERTDNQKWDVGTGDQEEMARSGELMFGVSASGSGEMSLGPISERLAMGVMVCRNRVGRSAEGWGEEGGYPRDRLEGKRGFDAFSSAQIGTGAIGGEPKRRKETFFETVVAAGAKKRATVKEEQCGSAQNGGQRSDEEIFRDTTKQESKELPNEFRGISKSEEGWERKAGAAEVQLKDRSASESGPFVRRAAAKTSLNDTSSATRARRLTAGSPFARRTRSGGSLVDRRDTNEEGVRGEGEMQTGVDGECGGVELTGRQTRSCRRTSNSNDAAVDPTVSSSEPSTPSSGRVGQSGWSARRPDIQVEAAALDPRRLVGDCTRSFVKEESSMEGAFGGFRRMLVPERGLSGGDVLTAMSSSIEIDGLNRGDSCRTAVNDVEEEQEMMGVAGDEEEEISCNEDDDAKDPDYEPGRGFGAMKIRKSPAPGSLGDDEVSSIDGACADNGSTTCSTSSIASGISRTMIPSVDAATAATAAAFGSGEMIATGIGAMAHPLFAAGGGAASLGIGAPAAVHGLHLFPQLQGLAHLPAASFSNGFFGRGAGSSPPPLRRPSSRNQSGLRGVYYDIARKGWRAVISFKGKQLSKYFLVARLGNEEAKRRAIECRKEWDRYVRDGQGDFLMATKARNRVSASSAAGVDWAAAILANAAACRTPGLGAAAPMMQQQQHTPSLDVSAAAAAGLFGATGAGICALQQQQQQLLIRQGVGGGPSCPTTANSSPSNRQGCATSTEEALGSLLQQRTNPPATSTGAVNQQQQRSLQSLLLAAQLSSPATCSDSVQKGTDCLDVRLNRRREDGARNVLNPNLELLGQGSLDSSLGSNGGESSLQKVNSSMGGDESKRGDDSKPGDDINNARDAGVAARGALPGILSSGGFLLQNQHANAVSSCGDRESLQGNNDAPGANVNASSTPDVMAAVRSSLLPSASATAPSSAAAVLAAAAEQEREGRGWGGGATVGAHVFPHVIERGNGAAAAAAAVTAAAAATSGMSVNGACDLSGGASPSFPLESLLLLGAAGLVGDPSGAGGSVVGRDVCSMQPTPLMPSSLDLDNVSMARDGANGAAAVVGNPAAASSIFAQPSNPAVFGAMGNGGLFDGIGGYGISMAAATGHTCPIRGLYYDSTNRAWAANMRINGRVIKKSFSVRRYGTVAKQLAIEARRAMEEEFGRYTGVDRDGSGSVSGSAAAAASATMAAMVASSGNC